MVVFFICLFPLCNSLTFQILAWDQKLNWTWDALEHLRPTEVLSSFSSSCCAFQKSPEGWPALYSYCYVADHLPIIKHQQSQVFCHIDRCFPKESPWWETGKGKAQSSPLLWNTYSLSFLVHWWFRCKVACSSQIEPQIEIYKAEPREINYCTSWEIPSFGNNVPRRIFHNSSFPQIEWLPSRERWPRLPITKSIISGTWK